MAETEVVTQRDEFDRAHGALEGLPRAVWTREAVIKCSTVLVGNVETYVIQTCRWDDGETVFVQLVSASRTFRLVLPPKVTATIARQALAASATLRSRHGRRIAEERKAAGKLPGFLKNPGQGGRGARRPRRRRPRPALGRS